MPRKRAIFHAVALALVLVVLEASSALTTWLLVRRGWMASIPTFSRSQVAYYLANRNPSLGWGPAVDAQGRVTRLSPREDPSFAATAPACVSTYGDSFTAGSEVQDDSTYPHDLGIRLGCRVANYGIHGYGSDQAMMLFRAQRHLDAAPVVVLGHVSENVLRNVSQYRQLLYPGQGEELAFKPSFTVQDGELRLRPVPVTSEADVEAFERDPDVCLRFDAFRSRPRRNFPYSFALARWLLADFHVRARLLDVPRHAVFYSPDHPSHALALTVAILRAFASEALGEGRRPIVLLIPVAPDFLYYGKTGIWVDQPMADALRRRGLTVVHAGPLMVSRLRSSDPCNVFGNCSAHFNARGYQMLADVVNEALQRDGPSTPVKAN
jgi:hypothetical protein